MSECLVTTSWDDGAEEDLRLAELLQKYDIPATFYIPQSNPERLVISPADIRLLAKDFEIGSHTATHSVLTQVSLDVAWEEVRKGKAYLEDVVGKEVAVFAYPNGDYSDEIKQLVGLAGHSYARTTKLFDTTIVDPLVIGTTVHAYNHHWLLMMKECLRSRLFRLGDCNRSWTDFALCYLDYCLVNGGVFHLWGHSWEIEKCNQWGNLETVLKYIKTNTSKSQRVSNSQTLSLVDKQTDDYYASVDPQSYHDSQVSQHSDDITQLMTYFDTYDRKYNRILEVGCGTGRLSSFIRNAEYIGVDSSKNFIDLAKKGADSNHSFICADGFSKQKGTFDLILVWGTLESTGNPYRRIQTLLSSLRKGGTLVFTVHNSEGVREKILNTVRRVIRFKFPRTEFSKSMMVRFGDLDDGYTQVVDDVGEHLVISIKKE